MRSSEPLPAASERRAASLSTPGPEESASLPSANLAAFTGDPNFMTSLARGLTVIQAFTQKKRQLTISQLSVKTGLSRAAVRRCLYTLAKLGFAGSDDGSRYSLRPRLLKLSHTFISSMPLAASAQPVMRHLTEILHESCSIATLDGIDVVYV